MLPCPCCGHMVECTDPATICKVIDLAGPLAPRMLELLASHFGQWVASERLVSVMWEFDPDGGPLNTKNILSVVRNRINKRLAATPIMIEGRAWSGYRMIWRTPPQNGAAQ